MKISIDQLEKELGNIFQKYVGKPLGAVIRCQVLNDIVAMFQKHDVDGGKYVIDIQEKKERIIVKIKDMDVNVEKDILKEIILSRYSKN